MAITESQYKEFMNLRDSLKEKEAATRLAIEVVTIFYSKSQMYGEGKLGRDMAVGEFLEEENKLYKTAMSVLTEELKCVSFDAERRR